MVRCNFPGHPKNGNLDGDWVNRLEGTSLRLVCDEGYELKGVGEVVCKNGKWSATLGTCEELAQHGGRLDFSVTLNGKPITVPKELKLGITRFPIVVKYLVRDEAGYHAECRLNYRVVDKEPPKFEYCPDDIVKTTSSNDARVIWKEPRATDNSGDVRVFCDRPNGAVFYEGSSSVTCTAIDNQGNKAESCVFKVIIKLRCIDHSNFPIAQLLPGVTIPDPSSPCSVFAANPQKCNEVVAQGLPDDFVWKKICKKTCKAC
ncbi:sushi, von Willebrand factor type A, EGF and pentraxin domain-containing protein 1-like [Dendronephthya gigantea]|uniref:sushi, von Willebrand factor type A, EGF and pentraxin domain-containing protein 1-like n=1 Tax=Dendronephthya gigantea TaxID=151771 RepID=UPI00106D3F3C|nr:sushi, von Willebrand factor type A, EGF and pentraxin domain-containing protein 1-like [Dendronephthya gigantea]